MAISFECEGCGKAYTVRDDFAGKTGECKQCGHRMLIPTEPDPEPQDLGFLPPPSLPRSSPPLAFKPPPSSAKPGWPSPGEMSPSLAPPSKPGFFSSGGNALGILVVIAGIGLRMYFKWDRGQARARRNPQANVMAPPNAGPGDNPRPDFAADPTAPIRMPRLPDPGQGREVEPGVMLHEIRLGPARPPFGSPPGQGGKLWLYLPSGEHPAKSLPCVLITAAGSNLLSGMELADDDRPEHLPYVRAGFAVLAFELDGALQDRKKPSEMAMSEALFRFLNARAGLVNAKIALEYALTKVPEVDPSKISVAGHSSAGTLATLFAEDEGRLKACVAFAPALDLEGRFGQEGVVQLKRAGAGDLAVRYSPKVNADKLKVPLFLFHARDDSNVPVLDSEAFAAYLQAMGKPVTLDLVDDGEHYDSMIQEGIPHAIDWLKGQGLGPGR